MSQYSFKRVLLIDAFEFRRACLHNFLTPWAAEEGLELVSLAPAEAHDLIIHDGGFAMLIYDAASSHGSFHRRMAEIEVLRTLCPNTPVAVISDSEDPDELAATLDIGIQAYLHDAVSPELALRALSFVARGGTYFSPSTMVAAYHRQGGRARPPPHASLPVVELPADSRSPGDDEVQRSERSGSIVPYSYGDSPADPKEVEQALSGSVVHWSNHPAKANKPAAQLPLLTERQQAVLTHLCQGDPNKTIAKKLNLTETTVKVHVREIMRKLGVFNRTQVAVAVGRNNGESGEETDENTK